MGTVVFLKYLTGIKCPPCWDRTEVEVLASFLSQMAGVILSCCLSHLPPCSHHWIPPLVTCSCYRWPCAAPTAPYPRKWLALCASHYWHRLYLYLSPISKKSPLSSIWYMYSSRPSCPLGLHHLLSTALIPLHSTALPVRIIQPVIKNGLVWASTPGRWYPLSGFYIPCPAILYNRL